MDRPFLYHDDESRSNRLRTISTILHGNVKVCSGSRRHNAWGLRCDELCAQKATYASKYIFYSFLHAVWHCNSGCGYGVFSDFLWFSRFATLWTFIILPVRTKSLNSRRLCQIRPTFYLASPTRRRWRRRRCPPRSLPSDLFLRSTWIQLVASAGAARARLTWAI